MRNPNLTVHVCTVGSEDEDVLARGPGEDRARTGASRREEEKEKRREGWNGRATICLFIFGNGK